MNKFKSSKQILGKDIIIALKKYAENRDLQHVFKRHKDDNLDIIFNLWMKEKGRCRSIEASAGSFFFHEKECRSIYCEASKNPIPRFIERRKDGTLNLDFIFKPKKG